MNYQNTNLLEELAAQYALGTLRGLARRRFERLCRYDATAATAVRRWEDRLFDLTAQIAPVQPSAHTWRAIRRRLGHDRKASSRALPWWKQTQWAVAAGIAMLTAVITWWSLVALPGAEHLATITDQQQVRLWRIEAPADREELLVTSLPALQTDEQHAYELWALPKSGAAPVSLGLMPQRGKRALALNATQRLALAGAQKIAISLEPRGGSPTGAPTGPVLFVATVVGNG